MQATAEDTTPIIYKTKKVTSITTITCVIEDTYMGNFSILVYSEEESDIWIEKFADTYEDATKVADKLFESVCKKY